MLSRVVLLAGLAACNFTGHGAGDDTGRDAPAKPWLAGFTSRRAVDVGAAALPATEFPLAIRVVDPTLAGTIAVTAADGTTVLPLEIERYEQTTGALAAWVRVPALAAGTHLWLYDGGTTTPITSWVWDPARYQAVWHMSDGDLMTVHDSTGAGEDVVAATTPSTPGGADGMAGRARDFDGSDDELDHLDVANGNLDFGTHSATITLWVYKDHSAGGYDVVLIKGNASVYNVGYDLELGSYGWTAYVSDGSSKLSPTFGAADTYLNRWVALAVVIDRELHQLRLYADAALVATEDITTLGSLTAGYYFQLGLNGYQFAGLLDEVRLAGVVEDVDWLANEHANLADPTFVTVGAAEPR